MYVSSGIPLSFQISQWEKPADFDNDKEYEKLEKSEERLQKRRKAKWRKKTEADRNQPFRLFFPPPIFPPRQQPFQGENIDLSELKVSDSTFNDGDSQQRVHDFVDDQNRLRSMKKQREERKEAEKEHTDEEQEQEEQESGNSGDSNEPGNALESLEPESEKLEDSENSNKRSKPSWVDALTEGILERLNKYSMENEPRTLEDLPYVVKQLSGQDSEHFIAGVREFIRERYK